VETVKRALSWLMVFAVGLAPMLVYWMAGLIGHVFRGSAGFGERVAGRPETRGSNQRNGAT
jgi:hypothetical protein